ncbi:threonine/serine exporter family protein [Hutsoniella sourekii]|uniref:threonine/serine ThrE exporter family protein n=1 Tax=Hutsoniella sourekii TaxID=87650 RepID=UPI0004835BC9|nr:threonine/serine exporter family protein [Hutsoniella sourekii]
MIEVRNINKHLKQVAEVAGLAGRIMLESHAESYRVEDTVVRILQTSGLSYCEAVSNTTSLIITLDDEDENFEPITIVRRISERGNHLNKIYRVNNISRLITSNQISLDEAYERLSVIDESEYTPYSKDLSVAIMVVAFAILLGGNFWEIIFSFLAGAVVASARLGKEALNMNEFLYGIFSTMITSFFITLGMDYMPVEMSSHILIISALMPLYPGTAFTNAIRDTLKGDYLAGLARMTDAGVSALSLAIGVVIGLSLYNGVSLWL